MANVPNGTTMATGPFTKSPKATQRANFLRDATLLELTTRQRSIKIKTKKRPNKASAVAVLAIAQGPKLVAEMTAANKPARGPQSCCANRANAKLASQPDKAEGNLNANSFKPKIDALIACNQ